MTRRPIRIEVARAVARHRALLAGGLTAGAVAVSLGVLAPQPAVGVAVLRMASDLPAGAALTSGDLVRGRVERSSRPDGALTSVQLAVGRLLASPVRRGEVLTDVRLAGAALLPPTSSGLVAVPVRLADRASVALLHPGDRIDVLAAPTAASVAAPRAGVALVIASGAVVLAVPTAADASGDGALVVVAERPEVAARLAAAALSSRLSFTLRPRS